MFGGVLLSKGHPDLFLEVSRVLSDVLQMCFAFLTPLAHFQDVCQAVPFGSQVSGSAPAEGFERVLFGVWNVCSDKILMQLVQGFLCGPREQPLTNLEWC